MKSLKKLLIGFLTALCACVLTLSIAACDGCNDKPNPDGKTPGEDSIFFEQKQSYTLESDYTLSAEDEAARTGAGNEVKLGYACEINLSGHTLDLAGRTLTIVSDATNCKVTLKGGTVKGGKLNISVPKGDIDFDELTIDASVQYELEAASQTIRFSNAKLQGACTIKSDTHVDISSSTVSDITLAGNGTLNAGSGAELGQLKVSESAKGATVNVSSEASVTGSLSIGAAANVVISGTVAAVKVEENVTSSADAKLSVTVQANAEVGKVDVKGEAEVSLAGKVAEISVASEAASVKVDATADVTKVEMKAAATMEVNGSVGNIVVADTAQGAVVDIKEDAQVSDVVIKAANTEVKVAENATVTAVKVVETVKDTVVVPETVTKEEITAEAAEEYFKHTHIEVVVSKKEATCTEAGETVYGCADSDEYERKITLPALGHKYVYEIVKPATETENGEAKNTCSRCGHVETIVIPAKTGISFSVSGLPEMLQKMFGNGITFSLDKPVVVSYTEEIHYNEGYYVGETDTTANNVMWIDQLDVKLDFSSTQKVLGTFCMVANVAEVDSFTSLNVATLEADEQQKIYAYINHDVVYVYLDMDGDQENEIISISQTIDFIKSSEDVPQPVKMLVGAILDVINNGITAEQFDKVAEAIGKVVEAVKGLDLNVNVSESKLVAVVLEKCFDKTEANGTTTYTLNVEKVEAFLGELSETTVGAFIDKVAGEGSADAIKQLVDKVPTMSVNTIVSLVNDQLVQLGTSLDALYPVIENAIKEATGKELDLAELVEQNKNLTIVSIVANENKITPVEAAAIVNGYVTQVKGAIDGMTLDQAATLVMQWIKGMGGHDEPNKPVEPKGYDLEEEATVSVFTMLIGMVHNYKDGISLSVAVADKKVTVTAGYGLYAAEVELDLTDGVSVEAAVSAAQEAMGSLAAQIKNGAITVTGGAMGYDVALNADINAGTLSLVVATGEGEAKSTLAAVTVGKEENVPTVTATVMGVEVLNASGTFDAGEATITVPVQGNTLVITVATAKVVDKKYTVTVGVMGATYVLTVDCATKDVVKLSCDTTADDVAVNIAKVEVTFRRAEGKLVGASVDYLLKYDIPFHDESYYYESTTTLHEESGAFTILFAQDVTVDDAVVEAAKGDAAKFEKVVLTDKYDSSLRLVYVEENGEAYYVLRSVYQYTEDMDSTLPSEDYVGTLREYVDESAKIPAVNGVPAPLYFNYSKDCTDWYHINFVYQGAGVSRYTVSNGTFKKENGLWVANGNVTVDEDASREKEFFFKDELVCYYNTTTKEVAKESQHSFDYTGSKLLDGSEDCYDGALIVKECTTCHLKDKFEYSGHYTVEEVKTISTECGDSELVIHKCVVCGNTNTDWKNMYNHRWVYGETDELTAADFTAIGASSQNMYYGNKSTRACAICNFKVVDYTWYTHTDAEGCLCHNTTAFFTVNSQAQTEKLEYVASETPRNSHYTTYEGLDYDGEKYDEHAAKIAKIVAEVRAATGETVPFTAIRVSGEQAACKGCGKIMSAHYYIKSVEYESVEVNLDYNDAGEASHWYYNLRVRLTDATKYFKKYHLAVEAYEVSGEINTIKASNAKENSANVYVSLYNAEEDYIGYVRIYEYSTDARVYWSNPQQCQSITYYYDIVDGQPELRGEPDVTENHNYQRVPSFSCCENGRGEVCSRCGAERKVYEHEDGDYEIYDRPIYDGIVIVNAYKYYCCETFMYLTISLENDVVLQSNLVIYGEEVRINLNGHTIDLNGYDLVIYGNASLWPGNIVIGNTEANEGGIINSKQTYPAEPAEGEKPVKVVPAGMLVICANKTEYESGNLDLGNLKTNCVFFPVDNVSFDELAAVVAELYGGYKLCAPHTSVEAAE